VVDLSNIPAVDVVIGLAFVYFLLSLVISSLTETVSALLQLRWKTLEHGLRELFENSGAGADLRHDGERLCRRFHGNPRIKALWKETGHFKPRGPSYIPPRVFALALLETLDPRTADAPEDGGMVPADEVTALSADEVDAKLSQWAPDYDVVAQAKRAALAVPNPVLQKWLMDALTKADAEREDVLTSLETSFDSLTNRISGWYKRHASIWVFVFALATACALNVDSYAIGSRLWKDEAVRSAIATQATKLTDADGCKSQNSSATSGTGEQIKVSLEDAARCVTEVKALGLPVGWAASNRPDSALGWVAKVLGIVVTVFALMLGAPFWFDTLSKLARLRNTGKPEGTAATTDQGKPKS
jgi:hypothetical protein